jgi:phospholipid/cholesterol/gamma-HCH transport system substrate-binding protein
LKFSRELKTGTIALIAIAVVIWGYNFLKKQQLFETSRVYYSEFNNVQGLTSNSIVTLNGLQVGNVNSIKFNPKKKGSLIVAYTLNTDFTFSDQTTTVIKPAAFIGGAELEIIPSYDGKNAKSGAFLKGSVEQSMIASITDKLNPLDKKLNTVLTDVDLLINNLNNTLDLNTQQKIKSVVSKLDASLSSFKNASKSLDDLLVTNKTKFSTILDNANNASKNLNNLTNEFSNAKISSKLKTTMSKLDQSLMKFEKILTKVENGDGSIAKLLNDKGLYNNLESASKEMEELLREMKEHPKRFVHFSLFGKKDKRGYIKDTIDY